MVFGNDNQALALGNHTEARLLPSLNTCVFVQHRHSWMTWEEERAWYAAVRHIVCGILGTTESDLIKPLDTKYGQLIIKINRFKEDLTMHRFHSALREVLAAVISVSLVMGMHASASANTVTTVPKLSPNGKVVAMPMCTLYLYPDGSVSATDYDIDKYVSPWKNVVDLDADLYGVAALTSGGKVYTTAQDSTAGKWKNIVSISVGENHLMGVCADGTVRLEGTEGYNAQSVRDWRNIISVSAGRDHCVGLRSDGTVVSAGSNAFGQCDVSGWRNITAVFAEDTYTVGLRADGTVVTAGTSPEQWAKRNCSLRDTAAWRGIVSIATGPLGIFGIKNDGTLISCPEQQPSYDVYLGYFFFFDYSYFAVDWTDLAQISVSEHVVGLKNDGSMVSFGGPQCGEGDPCRLTSNTLQHRYIRNGSQLECYICGCSAVIPAYNARTSRTCLHHMVRYYDYEEYSLYYACTLCGMQEKHGPVDVTQLRMIRDTNGSGKNDVKVGNWTDMVGNEFRDALKFWVVKRSGYSDTESIDYALGGKYNHISGRISMSNASDRNAKAYVCIYADGRQIARFDEMSTEDNEDRPFSVDITGAKTLRIECVGTTKAFAHCIVAAYVYE